MFFNYKQEDVDQAKQSFSYVEEESKKMMIALKNQNFKLATEHLKRGADPNYIFWNYDTKEIESVFTHIFYSLWNSGVISKYWMMEDSSSFSYHKDNPLLADQPEKLDLFITLKNFFSAWTENGGDVNKKVIVHKSPDYYPEEKVYHSVCSLADTIYSSLLISIKKENLTESHFSSYNLSNSTSDLVELLKKIKQDFIKELTLEPVYNNKESVFSIAIREGWKSEVLNDFVFLLDQNNPYFLIDEKGDTPLHYPINHFKQQNFNIILANYLNNDKKIQILEYIQNYKKNIVEYFYLDTLMIKNKENLYPIEKMISEKAYPQAIAMALILIKEKPEFLENIDINMLSLKKIKEYYGDFYYEKDDKYLSKLLIDLDVYIEKKIISDSLEKNEPNITALPKKRI